MQREGHAHHDHYDAVSWLCWYCPRLFSSSATRTHHMSVRHPRKNRLVAPVGFLELHDRPTVVERQRAAANEALAELAASRSAVRSDMCHAPRVASPSSTPASASGIESGEGDLLLGGLGVVRVPTDAYARGTLGVPRRRHVLQTSTASRIRAY